MDENFDVINNPSHYCEGRKHQPIDVVNEWELNFNLGNVIKYISRAGRKDEVLQDLKKAAFYLNYEIKRIEDLYVHLERKRVIQNTNK